MILVDTSIWIDHLNKPHPLMHRLLMHREVLMHPFVIGEIAMGSLRARKTVLETLSRFETSIIAKDAEVLQFTTTHKLFGKGIGYLDAHLLTSVQLTPDALLWTRDTRLQAAAVELSLAYKPLLN